MGRALALGSFAALSLATAACGGSSRSSAGASSYETIPSGAPSASFQGGPLADGELVRALKERMTVWTKPDGRRVYVRHCRKAPGGCERRVAVLGKILEAAALRHDLDPFLLAAIAIRESALDPSARGRAGEAGIVQLHPRGLGRGVRFVQDDTYRKRCITRPDGCQRPVVDHAARHLKKAIRRCGDLPRALGLYNTGSCRPRRAYVDKILKERRRLMRLAAQGR